MKNRVVLRIAKFYENEQPLPMLEDVGLSRLKTDVQYRTGHDLGNTGRYVYKEISSDAEKLSEVLNTELSHNLIVRSGARPTAKDLRVIISKDALSVDQDNLEQDNLVLLSFDERKHGWEMDHTGHCPVQLTLRDQSPNILASIINDVMLDIYLANSTPIWPVVRNAIDTKGREWLYREKVNYVMSNHGNDSFYGNIDSRCGYIPFSSVARNGKHQLYENTVNIWDNFVLDRLSDFALSPEKIAKDLRQRKNIGGQLKKVQKLSRMIQQLPAGSWLLLFTNKYKGIESTLRCNPCLPAPGHGKIAFLNTKDVSGGVQDMLREQKLIALKFYKC